MSFSISAGNTDVFSISSDGGELSIMGLVDRETEDFYKLTVRASDGSKPSNMPSYSM